MLNFDTAIDGIKNWNNLRGNVEEMLDLLNQGNLFIFNPSIIFRKESLGVEPIEVPYIHAYPAVYDNRLKFILIDAKYDSKDYTEDEIAQHTYLCEVENNEGLKGHDKQSKKGEQEINTIDAIERVFNWKKYHNTWIPNQIERTEDGIYQCFVIPVEDYEEGVEHRSYFALKELENPGTVKYSADLIIKNSSTGTVFMDTVHPVPPFRPGVTTEDNFYLLEVAQNV